MPREKNQFSATELVAISKFGLSTKKLFLSNHPLYLYPVTIRNNHEGVLLKQLLSGDITEISCPDLKDPSLICSSRLIYVCTEYDCSDTYYWVTDLKPTNYDNFVTEVLKSFKKGGIFYA